jgi:hypothetical protein
MLDGHCATNAETIYVGTLGTAICSETNAGAAQAPVCSLQSGIGLAVAGSKSVVVIRGTLAAGSTNISVSSPLTIVGKNSATVTATAAVGNACITLTQGEVHLRSLTIAGSTSPATGIGVAAGPGVTLSMDGCRVTNNPGGGIFLNGAGFDIENTTVSGNGPGQTTGGTLWGGVRVESLPPAGSPTTLRLVTIQNNSPVGLSCTASIAGSSSVLATGNNGSTNPAYQISGCGFSSCTPGAGTACGAP